MNGLNILRDIIHQNAVEHGWWEPDRSFGEIIALCHSELSEALEAYRDNKPMFYHDCPYTNTRSKCPDQFDGCQHGKNVNCHEAKPEGIAVELADCIIRILDYCGKTNIDIDTLVKVKHQYNKTRPYRHGGKML